jgi:hypothetical protein
MATTTVKNDISKAFALPLNLPPFFDAKDTVTILINIDILINRFQIVPIMKRNLPFLLFYS